MSAVLDPSDSLPPRERSGPRAGVVFLRWLRKIHLWVGLWGALLGFLFGLTGILLNHRAVLKIPVERAVQRSSQLALPEADGPQDADQLEQWLQAELGMKAQSVRAFIRKRPVRKPFPDEIERERLVVAAPTVCGCCGSTRLSKLGEDVTETLEEIPRRFKLIETVREKFTWFV